MWGGPLSPVWCPTCWEQGVAVSSWPWPPAPPHALSSRVFQTYVQLPLHGRRSGLPPDTRTLLYMFWGGEEVTGCSPDTCPTSFREGGHVTAPAPPCPTVIRSVTPQHTVVEMRWYLGQDLQFQTPSFSTSRWGTGRFGPPAFQGDFCTNCVTSG